MDIIQKTRDDYNKIAPHFASTRQHAGELVQFKPFLANGQHILDWGCGSGRLLFLLENMEVSYVGIDQSLGLLKQAKKHPLTKGLTAHFYCTAHKEKKFKPSTFDLVFMIASFHHLPDTKTRLALLKKTYKEMKPGAKLILSNWNLESQWAKAQRKQEKGWKKLGEHDYLIPWKNAQRELIVERYYHHFTWDELLGLVAAAGFSVVDRYYEAAGERAANRIEGRNTVVIAEKPTDVDK